MKLYIQASVRTNNFTDEQMGAKIATTWQQANEKLGTYAGARFGVYKNYESDYQGDYLLAIATKEVVSSEYCEIPTDATYVTYTVNTENPNGLFETWQKIWHDEAQGTLIRAYTIDFEKYHKNGKITIHIATK